MENRYTLAQLAEKLSASLVGDPALSIHGVNTLEEASSHDASFLSNPRYREAMKNSRAGVICIDPHTPREDGKNYLITPSPSRTFQAIVELLQIPSPSYTFEGIHPTAIIDPTVQLAPNVTIGPYAVLDKDVVIGEHTYIGPHVCIGPKTTIGSHCLLHAGSIVRERCHLGNRVLLQPCAVIGSCGFGYTFTPETGYQKLEQLGIVVLEDDVEIGSHTTIDRARFKETRIRKGTKIDNLCQIAHNVEIGKHNAIAAQSGIAGSSTTGDFVILGGQVGVAGHVSLDNHVQLAAQSGVSKSLPPGKYRGSPAMPLATYQRQAVHVRRLASLQETVESLEKRIQELELRLKNSYSNF